MAEIFGGDVQPNARARRSAPRSAGVRCLASRHSGRTAHHESRFSGPLGSKAAPEPGRAQRFSPWESPRIACGSGGGSPAFRSWIRGCSQAAVSCSMSSSRAGSAREAYGRVRGLLRGACCFSRDSTNVLLIGTHDGHRSLLLSGSADRPISARKLRTQLLARRASVPASRLAVGGHLDARPGHAVC